MQDEGGPSSFEDDPSSPKSPLSPKKPWQMRENNFEGMHSLLSWNFWILWIFFIIWFCFPLGRKRRNVLCWTVSKNSNWSIDGLYVPCLGHSLYWCHCEVGFSTKGSYRFVTVSLLSLLDTRGTSFEASVSAVKREHLSEVRGQSSTSLIR